MTRLRWFLLGALAAGAIGFPVALYLVTRPSLRVVHTWPKEPQALYDHARVYLSVFESGTEWGAFPFSTRPTYAIYVGRDAGTPVYGHEMPFSFHGYAGDDEQAIKAAVVTWDDAGVFFTAPTKHRLFIPKEMFLGGR